MLKQKEEAFEHSSELSEGKLQGYDTDGPVTTTLLVSIDQIRGRNSLAADYLFLAACVNRKDIPLDFLEATSLREREDAIKVLNDYALITRRPAESALDLHQLVHGSLRRLLQKQKRLDQWNQHAIARLLAVFPSPSRGSRSKWRRLLPHAKYALSHSLLEQEAADRTTLRWKCAVTLLSDGRYSESEELFVQVVETRKRVLGEEHPDTLKSIGNLASTFWSQGRWKEAEELDAQVLETRKRVLGDEHPSVLKSMANLASAFQNQGRWKEAEELFVQVMDTSKRVLGAEHPDTLASMNSLAFTLKSQSHTKEAVSLMRNCFQLRKRILGPQHPHTEMSLKALNEWQTEDI